MLFVHWRGRFEKGTQPIFQKWERQTDFWSKYAPTRGTPGGEAKGAGMFSYNLIARL